MAAVPRGRGITINVGPGVERVVQFLVTDPAGTAVATGNGQVLFVVPPILDGRSLTDVFAAFTTAGTGADTVIQVSSVTGGHDLLSTPVTIEDGDLTSLTATAQPVVDLSASRDVVDSGDVLSIDVDAVGSGALGLQVALTFA